MEKNGSFGFAEGSACGEGQSQMCRLRAAKEFQNILCGGKKIKTRSVGLSCRQVNQPKLSEMVVFICLSIGQISCRLFGLSPVV